MGDERTYEYTIALRAVVSTDGMTADWVHLPYDFLAKVSNDIINKVRGVHYQAPASGELQYCSNGLAFLTEEVPPV